MPDPVQELLDRIRAGNMGRRAHRPVRGGAATTASDALTLDISTANVSLELPGPPAQVWRANYLQAKIEIESTVYLRLLHSAPGPDVTVGSSVEFGAMLSEAMELNLEVDLDVIDLSDAIQRGNVAALISKILEAVGLERQWELCHGIEVSAGACWDTDFCLLSASIEGSDIRFELPLPGSASRVEVRIPTGITLKFGLTPRGWAVLIRRFGGPAIRRIAGAIARLATSGGGSGAATAVTAAEAEAALAAGAGMSFASFAGIALVSVELGILARDLVVVICRIARREGFERDQERAYAHAYVYTVYYGRPLQRAPGEAVVAAMNRGYRQAQEDIQRHGLAVVRGSLQQHFLRGRTIALRPDGVPVTDVDVTDIVVRLTTEITRGRQGG